MARLPDIRLLFTSFLLLLAVLVDAAPTPQAQEPAAAAEWWMASIKHQGKPAFGGADYQVFRNVKDFGATGDGSTDDTDAINSAITAGNRCGSDCDSATTTPAIVYFPPGTYIVSAPLIQYYYTQFIGDAINRPVLKAAPTFQGMAVIDANPYKDGGANWYTNQNNFFRVVRNFVIDLTGLDQGTGTGIHWQVAQATSLQNIEFNMVEGGGEANKQQGIFMENGSGGFMTDLTFNGGNYGAFFGNQQFTTRNLNFNNCNTAIYMIWNWAWTFKSLNVNNCGVALNMAQGGNNQTVGSVLILDSKVSGTHGGIVTSYGQDSIPEAGGTLILDNVDFSNSDVAVAKADGSAVLPGGSVVEHWVQGNVWTPGSATSAENNAVKARHITARQASQEPDTCMEPQPEPEEQVAPSSIAGLQQQAPTTAQSPSSAPTTGQGSSPESQLANPSPTSESPPPTAAPPQFASNAPEACPSAPVTKSRVSTALPAPTKLAGLLGESGKVFERSKPQYEDVSVDSFVSVKSAGAKGDGQTDDTAAIQGVLDSATPDQIVFFDHGAYVITSTLKVPSNIKITGEIWPLLMASGDAFSDMSKPTPMLQVGQPGDTGTVEISDLMLETKGPAPGAILIEWNVAEESQGSVGMWDVHTRVGGSAGTELQSDKCAKTPEQTTEPNPECFGAFMLVHVTESASGYFENNWFWVSDHELDLADHGQINIYNGRGVLIESTKPLWMYGTASEHNVLYNYQIDKAQNVYMALIQVETPYFQSNPDALVPFTPSADWNDPDFANCTTETCKKAWALRILNSSDIFMYGGGVYSFFENYDQTCLETESCQENIVEVECSETYLYGLSTKASTNMITSGGKGLVPQDENRSNFCSTVALFRQEIL